MFEIFLFPQFFVWKVRDVKKKKIRGNRNRDKDWNFIVQFAMSVEENEGLRSGTAEKIPYDRIIFSQFLHEYILFRSILSDFIIFQ